MASKSTEECLEVREKIARMRIQSNPKAEDAQAIEILDEATTPTPTQLDESMPASDAQIFEVNQFFLF